MASVLCKNQNGVQYIYGVVSFRRELDKKPTVKMTCLGKIDKDTNKPIYNHRFYSWMEQHGLSPENALSDYLNKNKKNIIVDFSDNLLPSNNNFTDDNSAKITNINNKTGIIHSNVNTIIPKYSIEQLQNAKKIRFGATHLLDYISNHIGLTQILNDIFLDDAKKLLSLSFFNVIEHKPSMYCKYFVAGNILSINSLEVTTQKISELLDRITDSDKANFYRIWAEKINDNEYLSLDTTLISTYSSNISKNSRGYNKQHKKLQQVNLCLLFCEISGLPVYATIYDRSLNDVITLIRAIKQTSIIKNRAYKLVLDSKFYSKNNINYLLFSENKSDFLLSVPGTTILKNKLIEEHKYIFNNINYAIPVNNDQLFGTTKRFNWENKKFIYAHIFINPKINDASRNKIIEDFDIMYNNAVKNPELYINDPDYSYALIFMRSSKSPTGYIVKKNQKAYYESRSKAGWFVLISNSIKDAKKAIEIYRRRDTIKKSFNMLKNFMKKKCTDLNDDNKYENKIFVSFLSLIFLSFMHNIMKDNDIYKLFTIDQIFSELNTINGLKVDEENLIIDPLTKITKDIYDLFKCPYPISKIKD
jgi:transposase